MYRSDRICNAAGGHLLFSGHHVLVIDMGTCNKYDFIDKNGVYHGGSIAPGFGMRFAAMHKFTAGLPLLKPTGIDELIGKSTKTSMETGVFRGVIGELNEFITQYQSRFHDIKVVLTGGYAAYFDKVLKNIIFADPNLTLKGLNSILIHQKF